MTAEWEGPEWAQQSAAQTEQQFYDLLDDKAWRHLGITGTEFMCAWREGRYADDRRPEVTALNRFMRTGEWTPA